MSDDDQASRQAVVDSMELGRTVHQLCRHVLNEAAIVVPEEGAQAFWLAFFGCCYGTMAGRIGPDAAKEVIADAARAFELGHEAYLRGTH